MAAAELLKLDRVEIKLKKAGFRIQNKRIEHMLDQLTERFIREILVVAF
jgi:hypothetical protein